jgi:hypothetical protein
LPRNAGSRSGQVLGPEEGDRLEADRVEPGVVACAAIDDAEHGLDRRAQRSELLGRRDDLSTSCDHVLDDEHSAGDLGTLSELRRAVGLRLLAHEGGGDAGLE